MERYHIYKLGIAIIFYAIYNRRPITVVALSTQQNGNGDEFVYYQGVQGKPGVDFPVYARIPKTSFSCKKVESGYYADLETSCQVFHICNGGAKISFLCPNGTIFQQSDLICEWWFKVNCTNSPSFYSESAEQLREESWKRKNYRKSESNRNTPRKKPQLEQNNDKRNEIPRNGFNDKLPGEDKGVVAANIRDQNANSFVPVHRETDEVRKKQVSGERGGRKFKENTYNNNFNIKNELTDNDLVNSDEMQVPQETASFYKNNQNTIPSSDKPTTKVYPNHKETYSEVLQPKFYSTKAISSISQTIPPQTYSTNRIPLNDGKPFVVSTPKSAYNIQINGFSGSHRGYNRATTESFKYSPTVPPFTTVKKSQLTTVVPKIIVDSDTGSDVSNGKQHIDLSPTQPHNEPRQYNEKEGEYTSEVNYETQYTTPNSIRSETRKSISFTENINTFSGLDDIIHTPTTDKYGKINVQIYSASNSKEGTPIPKASSTTTAKYGATYSSTSNSLPSSNSYDTSTKSDYFPSIIVATSVRNNEVVGDQNVQGYSKVAETTTTSNYYQYNADTNTPNNINENKYGKTVDSYLPPVVKSSTGYGVDAVNNSPNVVNNIVQGSFKRDQTPTTSYGYQSNGLLPSSIGTSRSVESEQTTSAYNNANESKTVTSSGNLYISNTDSIPFNAQSRDNPSAINNVQAADITSRQKEQIPNPSVVQHNSQITDSTRSPIDTITNEPPESSYGDACGDDIVYSELPQDQVVVGKNKIVIDDTTVPTTETNEVKITINNVSSTSSQPSQNTIVKEPTKPVTDSTIFRIQVQQGQRTDATEKPNGFYVTRHLEDNNRFATSSSSTAFSSGNTYLPKQTSQPPSTSNNNNFQTNSHTYLPKRPTPAPFSLNGQSNDLNNKEILKEGNNFPQFINTRENHLKTSAGVPQISDEIQRAFALKPKPFELPPKQTDSELSFGIENRRLMTIAPLPEYQVSSARPFSLSPPNYQANTVLPTLATPFPTDNREVSEHLRNMLNTLNEIINERNKSRNNTDSPRPGLVIPPSVGPQTLHTLAVYFANALEGISSENGGEEGPNVDESQAINALLTHSTINKYNELFKDGTTTEIESHVTTISPEVETEGNDLEGQDSKTAVTPRVRQLAQVFTKALSSYLDDPDMFKKVLEEARPTEPPSSTDGNGGDDDELLNYSDADIKPNLPRLSTTTSPPVPTWGYILAPSNSISYEHNTVNLDGENLQSADSQSFATQFNNYIKEKHYGKGGTGVQNTTPLDKIDNRNLPSDHWTSSTNVTKLWQDKLYTSPQTINEYLNASGVAPIDSRESGTIESVESSENSTPSEYADIGYRVTTLPKMELNSTQVHKILVDIVNSTRDEGNKLKRILHKLNTTQEDFLNKMREIEQNPLTRRLILLLISECGSNITHLEKHPTSDTQSPASNSQNKQSLNLFESSRVAEQDKFTKGSSPFPVYVDPSLKDEDEDNRALQLLNSLYTIAAKYGK